MPYKFNESRRHKIPKAKYKVVNWPEYNESLRQRGNFMLWFSDEALAAWHPDKTGKVGRPMLYSPLAIQSMLLIRRVFRLPLRQTQGVMSALVDVLEVDIQIPDFSCCSRRSTGLPQDTLAKATQPGSVIIVDSTGLKVYGKDEWHQEKHSIPARKTWRKLHLAVDENHQISACELTTTEIGDPSAIPDLLDQVDSPFDYFIADGAYDGMPVIQAVQAKQPHANIIVPPHKTAVDSGQDTSRAAHSKYSAIWQNRLAKPKSIWLTQLCRACHATV